MARSLSRLVLVVTLLFGFAFAALTQTRTAHASTILTACVVSISSAGGTITGVVQINGSGSDYIDIDIWYGTPANEFQDVEYGDFYTGGYTYTFTAPDLGYTVFGFEIDNTPIPVGGCTTLTAVDLGCTINEGTYQDKLTRDTQLFWAPDVKKPAQPTAVIPAGQVVTVINNSTPGWLYISWACNTYYIKSGGQTVNPAPVSKPYLGGK